jgi:multidrug efflux pump subunit AcrA (membrane-fusion protein)
MIGLVILAILISACEPLIQVGQSQVEQVVVTATPLPTAPAAQRTTYTVERGDVLEEFVFRGRWLPRDQMELSFEVNGSVRSVNVQRGDTVVAGQVLADLQIDDLEAQLQTQELNLQSAQRRLNDSGTSSSDTVVQAQFNLADANLSLDNQQAGYPWTRVENARQSLERAERQLENAQRDYDDAVSHPDTPASQVDQAYESLIQARESLASVQNDLYDANVTYYQYDLNVRQQENRVRQAEMDLQEAQLSGGDADLVDAVIDAQLAVDRSKEQIAQSTLIAPFDGVILEVTIRSGDSVQAFTSVITIALPEPLEAIATLTFTETQLLQIGQLGICEEANREETQVQCVVRQLPLSNRDVDQTVRVAATLPNSPQGALIDVTMILRESLDTLWLPPQAINEFGSRTFVVLQTPEGERVRDVVIGLETDERVEILSGVVEGDVIVQQ